MRAALLLALAVASSGCSLGFLSEDDQAPGDDGDPTPQPSRFRIFATSEAYASTFALEGGGDPLQVADQNCRLAGSAAGLVGRWRAWLSTPLIGAIERLPARGSWATMSGALVFGSPDEMSRDPVNAIREDQFGNRLTGDAYAWTGTAAGGFGSGYDCNGWTASVGYGTVGAVWLDDVQWTDTGLAECSRYAHLICVEY